MLAVSALTLGACAASRTSTDPATTFTRGPVANSFPSSLTAGPGGAMWFVGFALTQPGPSYVARITPNGAIRVFNPRLAPKSVIASLAAGPDGNLWFTALNYQNRSAIGRMSPDGRVTQFDLSANVGGVPQSIAPGPDGNLWFTLEEFATAPRRPRPAIGRITPVGVITLFTAGLPAGSNPHGITAGADGNVWFTDAGSRAAIGRITRTGVITEFTTGLTGHSPPREIAAGPDGNVWFSNGAPISFPPPSGAIGRITPDGVISEFTAGLPRGADPSSIARGPNDDLYFVDDRCVNVNDSTLASDCAIGRVTPSGAITEFDPGLGRQAAPLSIAAGVGRTLWFAAIRSLSPARAEAEIGRFNTNAR